MTFNYTIEKSIKVLAENWRPDGTPDGSAETKELNLCSWNDRPAQYDLRRWIISADGGRTPGRGITLSPEQAIAAAQAILLDAAERFSADGDSSEIWR